MRIGIIACETFHRDLDYIIGGDADIVHKEYLEFGLHEWPENLKKAVIDKVNGLEGKVDAVLLGYGICNSLKDVTKVMRVPTVQLAGDDCIGVMLTQEEYDRERKKCAGTMYHTPYFAEMNKEWFEKKLRMELPNFEELGISVDWFLEKMFEGYSRVLFIDDGLGGIEKSMELSRRFAADLKLKHECRNGTLAMLKDGLARTRELARKAEESGQSNSPNGVL
ncbi:MAG TPA: DUF1638 domain-containing protein [Methanomassiliicoccales archaeon]|nr:DUF1638 domain-containing protein [Methanomassiliicoccales archaeon]